MTVLHLSGYDRFSANVQLELHAEGGVFDLAGIGPNEIISRTGIDLNPCDAELQMTVDGRKFIWPITVVNGAVPFERAIQIVPRGEIQRVMPELATT